MPSQRQAMAEINQLVEARWAEVQPDRQTDRQTDRLRQTFGLAHDDVYPGEGGAQ
jgi:hypothetical protein